MQDLPSLLLRAPQIQTSLQGLDVGFGRCVEVKAPLNPPHCCANPVVVVASAMNCGSQSALHGPPEWQHKHIRRCWYRRISHDSNIWNLSLTNHSCRSNDPKQSINLRCCSNSCLLLCCDTSWKVSLVGHRWASRGKLSHGWSSRGILEFCEAWLVGESWTCQMTWAHYNSTQ